MKLILLFAALLLGAWLWRAGRRARLKDQGPSNKPSAPPQTEMVPCLHCSVLQYGPSLPWTVSPWAMCTEHRQLAEP
ncbi:MAG: hypothetical protein EBY25_02315 [Betaproteobacteria bacterium]|nr:hypothetical protein [Betaproteobacteria bacterium]